MIKYIDLAPYDIYGNPTLTELRPGQMQKTAKYENLMSEMQEFISGIKPQEGKAFLLIAAMGDQNWGANRNADFWPTEALSHAGHDYGYQTFEDNGHWYHQHNNKDPEKAFGKVIKSVYNPQMCRIELIVEVDLEKDELVRGQLARNEIIQVSMGASVAMDVCKVCHPNWKEFYKIPEPEMVKLANTDNLDEVHQIGQKHGVDLSYITQLNPDGGPVGIHSKTSKYCQHMRLMRNKLLPTGERACVINLRPKFFDISDVGTNADKSAFVLDKVASAIQEADEQDLLKRLNANEKQAEQKKAENKEAEIDKEIPGEVISDDAEAIKEYYAKRLLPEIVPYEKEIPDHVIDGAARKYSLGEILSTFMMMGMFPHPREFQRIVLIQTGDKDGLQAMANPDNVLTPQILQALAPQLGSMPPIDFGIHHDNINPLLGRLLEQFMPERSYYRPMVAKRIIMIKKGAYGNTNSYIDESKPAPNVIPALLATIGGVYMAAKLTGDKGLNDLVNGAMQHKGKVIAGLMGSVLLYNAIKAHNREMSANKNYNAFMEIERQKREQRLNKTSSLASNAASIGLPILGAYLWAGSAINKMNRGEDPGPIGTFVARNPMVAGLAGAALANSTTRKGLFGLVKGKVNLPQAPPAKINFGKVLMPMATISAPILATHLSAAHTMNKAQEGQPYNKVEGFIAKHPLAVGAAGAVALTRPLRDFVGNLGKYMVKGASEQLHKLEELDPYEQDKLICAYWELG